MNTKTRIAIVGIGGVLPGSTSIEHFWQNVLAGRDCAQQAPADRWALPADDAYASTLTPDHVNSKRQCFVDGFSFDPNRFEVDQSWRNLLPALDPMFHLLLHAGQDAWRSANTAGIDTCRAGIVIGNIALPTDGSSAITNELFTKLFEKQLRDRHGMNIGSGSDRARHIVKSQGASAASSSTEWLNRYVTGLPAGVLARALGLSGGAFTLDAACASSLYALKLASDELLQGRCDVMLAGGLSRPDCLYTQMGFSQLRAVSPTGTCSPFDENADGLVVGEGCGMAVLKRLEDALAAGDHIYATIAGVGLSNDIDGNLMLPASEGQLRAMRQAYLQAGWSPDSIDLIECHGTGTPTGDAVEFNSLRQLWADDSLHLTGQADYESRTDRCVIGSVKSNVGHLLTGAGSAGLIKTLLAMRDGVLPPTANFQTGASKLNLEQSPFEVLGQSKPWSLSDDSVPRRAAISAFGFGGINAHVLLEHWADASGYPDSSVPGTCFDAGAESADVAETNRGESICRSESDSESEHEPIAIVGMAAHFGPWTSLDAFRDRLFSDVDEPAARDLSHTWGETDAPAFAGWFIDEIRVPIGRFRIPPSELADCLPQQLLMLQIAADAIEDANLCDDESARHRRGVFVGIGLDLNTTNFHFRWSLKNKAKQWVGEHSGEVVLSANQHELLDEWTQQLRDAVGPPLSANRTMGSLGGIVASRVARAFRVGGPSFTISSEETSGLTAVATAVQALRQNDIDSAIVGAVDLAGDLRAVLGQNDKRPSQATTDVSIGEGAGALILKRQSDAIRDGDKIYALIKGVSIASSNDGPIARASASAYSKAWQQAHREARFEMDTVGHIELGGSGIDTESEIERQVLERVEADSNPTVAVTKHSAAKQIGYAGAASGIASFISAALVIHHCQKPNAKSSSGASVHPWLTDRIAAPRRAAVMSMGVDGSAAGVALEQCAPTSAITATSNPPRNTQGQAGLFVVSGDTRDLLLYQLEQLESFTKENASVSQDIKQIATLWHSRSEVSNLSHGLTVALVATDIAQLKKGLERANWHVLQQSACIDDVVFYVPRNTQDETLSKPDNIAFVYPGAGNQYAGMGRQIALAFPSVLRKQEVENEQLASQFASNRFWSEADISQISHRDVIFGHVCVGAMMTDVLGEFGVKPNAVIGYSLGETTSLFSTRAWSAMHTRDQMLHRLIESPLFSTDLAGPCDAVKGAWGLGNDEEVNWHVVVVNCDADKVRAAVADKPRAYLLIINSPTECVIGGQRDQVEQVLSDLKCASHIVQGVTTVHCDVAHSVGDAYHKLHLFDTTPATGVTYYSGALGKSRQLTRESAAHSITLAAMDTLDFQRVIEAAYEDGVRTFIELGPGASCSRMISQTLGARPHVARSALVQSSDETVALLRSLAHLAALGVAIDISRLYAGAANPQMASSDATMVTVKVSGDAFEVPPPPAELLQSQSANAATEMSRQQTVKTPPTATLQTEPALVPEPVAEAVAESVFAAASASAEEQMMESMENTCTIDCTTLVEQASSSYVAQAKTQSAFVAFANQSSQFTDQICNQLINLSATQPPLAASPIEPPRALNREQCMAFAVGRIGDVLGDQFAQVDNHRTRVRLPDEPLMLVDRILEIEGEPCSMTQGRVVTEHDIHHGAWYLDAGRIPTCIAVEAGQADLFLSGYLGIDFITKGNAVYRLLDAVVTFHDELPREGQTILYDIRIDHFFTQGDTYLFRFEFDATVDGKPLLTMRKGCAGFFTKEELDAGKGVVLTTLDKKQVVGKKPEGWRWLAPLPSELGSESESYNEAQVDALRTGDLAACFGDAFSSLPLAAPVKIPSGRMTLVHRVLSLDPEGGRFGLGQIVGEADIHPDDWFLVCHFSDDQVMPGTLMYECGLHTLRILLMRWGWVGEAGNVAYEPIPGESSQLKCRGQVNEGTSKVCYELTVKEIGYGVKDENGDVLRDQNGEVDTTPYVLADALMYADGRAVVQMNNMSVRLTGMTKQQVETIWRTTSTSHSTVSPASTSASTTTLVSAKPSSIFNYESIFAFSAGKPSDAFGEPYLKFDQQRRIARLPRPPYQLLDRVTHIEKCEPFKLAAGGKIQADYDVPSKAWYFAANRQKQMPFAVLLEIALQPCGWLAGYLGSALASENDVRFRNLGGKATLTRNVTADTGTLTTHVTITNVAQSGGMIIQNFDFDVHDRAGSLYKGDTYFGFFSAEALAEQVGIREASLYEPTQDELQSGMSFDMPTHTPFCDHVWQMVDRVDLFAPEGGPNNLGYIQGSTLVRPDEWFFHAHFYQDPVVPGSLGLESFLQLLKYAAHHRWGGTRFDTMALNQSHKWGYRGQVIPADKKVTVQAVITKIDDDTQTMHANGFLTVDGRVIYQMDDFAISVS